MNARIVPMATVLALTLLTGGCTITVPEGLGLPGAAAQGDQPTDGVNRNKVVSSVRVTPDTLVITAGSARDMVGNVAYTDGSFDSAVQWSSSDDTILSVNPTTGRVSGVKPGIATVVAASTLDPSKKNTATVTVRSADVVEAFASIDPKEATLKVGDTVRLNATIRLSDGSESPNVTWMTDNSSVALVSNGLVTAIAPGTTTITAMAVGDSTKKASAMITVTE